MSHPLLVVYTGIPTSNASSCVKDLMLEYRGRVETRPPHRIVSLEVMGQGKVVPVQITNVGPSPVINWATEEFGVFFIDLSTKQLLSSAHALVLVLNSHDCGVMKHGEFVVAVAAVLKKANADKKPVVLLFNEPTASHDVYKEVLKEIRSIVDAEDRIFYVASTRSAHDSLKKALDSIKSLNAMYPLGQLVCGV